MTKAEKSVEMLEQSFGRKISAIKQGQAEFVKKFQEDPSHALSWSQKTFEESAELNVRELVLSSIQSQIKKGKGAGEALAYLTEYISKEAMRSARWPARSTSPVSNLLEGCKGQAFAMVAEELNGFLQEVY